MQSSITALCKLHNQVLGQFDRQLAALDQAAEQCCDKGGSIKNAAAHDGGNFQYFQIVAECFGRVHRTELYLRMIREQVNKISSESANTLCQDWDRSSAKRAYDTFAADYDLAIPELHRYLADKENYKRK